jgi:hypothetical protein
MLVADRDRLEAGKQLVRFRGSKRVVYKANWCLKCAERLFELMDYFYFKSPFLLGK